MNLFELTKALIDIPSLTGQEGELARFLASYLSELGFKVELQPVEGERANLIATAGAPPDIVFSTHLDTVPPHISSSEDHESIFGRGACDAKGIIAAQIFAARELLSAGFNRLGLLFTVDEEMGSLGASIANRHEIASSCRYLINGEPTDNLLAIGTKGSLRLRLETVGRSAHSAYPELGESAIEKMLDVLESLRRCEWPSSDFFGATTCNIGVIQGGTRPNVIPASAEAVLQIRLATQAATVQAMVEKAVGDQARIEYLSVHEPVRLSALEGFEQCVVRFTTDIPYLTRWGKPILLGPGSIFDAHTDGERIAKSELKRAVDLYISMARILSQRESNTSLKVSLSRPAAS
jgi:acetylornithine deacetylase